MMVVVPPLDPDQCYQAVHSRDGRFDGWFVTAVRTTGIYCRPSCPAITPKRANVDFYATAAAAQQRGFRACKRCRPDATPGSPEWNVRQDVVARAMRLIADGVVDREGVAGLAGRLGYSQRHLNRVVTDELGAGPLAIARAQRAQTARLLVETTAMSLTDVAFAAGFGSVRQFNDTVREVFATSPRVLRDGAATSRRGDDPAVGGGAVTDGALLNVSVRLPARAPIAWTELLSFIGDRAIPGVESWDGTTYGRTLALPSGVGVVHLEAHHDHVAARLQLSSWSDVGAAVQRVRRLLDLDNDPIAVDDALGSTRRWRRSFGRARSAGAGERGSLRDGRARRGGPAGVGRRGAHGGRTDRRCCRTSTRSTDRHAHACVPTRRSWRPHPTGPSRCPQARRDTIKRVAAAVADGDLELHVGVDAPPLVVSCWRCAASVRGPPTTWSCGASAIPTRSSPTTSASATHSIDSGWTRRTRADGHPGARTPCTTSGRASPRPRPPLRPERVGRLDHRSDTPGRHR
jgi:AraC family transcriptional regulator, regulatory protein of adaptative response / DNA-3-methyladenine glycosylase II